MICAFMFNAKDSPEIHELLRFIAQLGGCKNHDCLLVADAATPFYACKTAADLAKQSFREVRSISNGQTVSGWPMVPNSLFVAASKYIQSCWPQPWLAMQSDCVPLKSGWLDAIEDEYKASGAVFLGDVYSGIHSRSGLPIRMLSGIAVYPADAADLIVIVQSEPWDMTNREAMLKQGSPSKRIKNFYGGLDLPPTFVESKGPGSPKNALTLDQIPVDTVLWHRNKDGSLIRLLRQRMCLALPTISSTKPVIVYVYPGDVIPKSWQYAVRFIRSYRENPPGMDHESIVVLNKTKNNPLLQFLFGFLQGVRFLDHDDSGWDIGAYQAAARAYPNADLMVFFGTSTHLTQPGWLVRMVNAHSRHGPGIYGCMGNRGDIPIGVYPHIRTTGFWIKPSLFNRYPVRVTTPQQRYPFEHGKNCLTAWVSAQKLPVLVVTSNGEYEWKDWDRIPNGYRQGDESALLCKDRINELPYLRRQPPKTPNATTPNRNILSLPVLPGRQVITAGV